MPPFSEDVIIAFSLGILFTVSCLAILYLIDMWHKRDPVFRDARQDPIEYIEPTLEKGLPRVVHHDPFAL